MREFVHQSGKLNIRLTRCSIWRMLNFPEYTEKAIILNPKFRSPSQNQISSFFNYKALYHAQVLRQRVASYTDHWIRHLI